jgi:hypothetical protein
MSKKVLNYAGRRPMLLALIMATAILGLLFSGWLTPTPGRAQSGGGNPQPNQENTNCVATTNAWTGSCPSIVTNGLVSPTTIYQCGVTGPEMPTNIVVPVYSPTNIFTQVITYDKTNCTPVTNTENITYSVSGYFWTNFSSPYTSMPSKVTNSFSADCDVYVTSSDTNNCASPGLVNLATVTWNLPCPTTTNKPTLDSPTYSISDGWYGATINYNFGCADGWFEWECFPSMSDSCVTGGASTAGTAGQYGSWSDQLYTKDPSGGSCSMTAHQIIYFASVGGGGCTNDNSVCSVENDISIVITQTNAPATPPHGTIVTSVTIGGGFSTTSSY